jgi:hypothetical protein
MKNKYVKRSRITEAALGELFKYFSLDLDTRKFSILACVVHYRSLFRARIPGQYKQHSSLKEEIEREESRFGFWRIKGKRGRGDSGKTPVFGILWIEGLLFGSLARLKRHC